MLTYPADRIGSGPAGGRGDDPRAGSSREVPEYWLHPSPPRGLDIIAREFVYRRIVEQTGQGTATLLISEDLDEILSLAHRIAVIYEGEIRSVMDRAEATLESLGLLMGGEAVEQLGPAR